MPPQSSIKDFRNKSFETDETVGLVWVLLLQLFFEIRVIIKRKEKPHSSQISVITFSVSI